MANPANTLPEPPAQLKAVQSYMRIASDIERIDPVVAYWVRLYSTETSLRIDKDSPECKSFITALILYLEKFKGAHKDNEAVINQTVGQAHYENFVVALFNKADTLDRNGIANKQTVRMFFMAAVLFEAMLVFGSLTDEISKRAKYAKFKAAYIQKCLKLGQVPKPGPIEGEDPSVTPSGEQPQESLAGGTEPSADPASSLPGVPSDIGTKAEMPMPPPITPSKAEDPFILTPSPAPVIPQIPPQHQTTPVTYDSSASTNPTSSTTGTSSSSIIATKFLATNGAPLNAEDLIKGQKYIKFANSALQYDDIPTAVANLEKALKLLTSGQRSAD